MVRNRVRISVRIKVTNTIIKTITLTLSQFKFTRSSTIIIMQKEEGEEGVYQQQESGNLRERKYGTTSVIHDIDTTFSKESVQFAFKKNDI